MASFFAKFFGKNKNQAASSPNEMLEQVVETVIEKAGFDLNFSIDPNENGFTVNLAGGDSKLVTDKEGLLIDSFQIFLKRMLQNKFPEQKVEVEVDCEGFLESSAEKLRELAEKLKNSVLERGQAAYMRALPPRDRKVVHRYLAEEGRVKSQSVGEGFLKKIKITAVRNSATPAGGLNLGDGGGEVEDSAF